VGARVLISGDFRTSTASLKAAVADGLRSAGAHVLDAGQIPTPVAYFAHHYLKTDAVMIVTASHNPPDHNGLKLMLDGLPPTLEDLVRLRQQAESGVFRQEDGSQEVVDPVPAYEDWTIKRWNHLRKSNRMTLVLDPGNGAWSELAPRLLKVLGFRVHCLFCDIDGTFPNRPPDCARPANLKALKQEVVRVGAQLGIAWDGDGDRVAFVDDSGSVVSSDEVSTLMIRELVPSQENARVVYDIKLSDMVRRAILESGGHPLIERSGHAFIKRTLIEQQCIFGCEASGHYFFRELQGGDDGLFAALVFLEILARRGVSLADLRKSLTPIFVTPDLRLPAKILAFEEIAGRLRDLYTNSPGTTIDGLRLETDDGFILVRKSVTEPVVTMRLEGFSRDQFRHLVEITLETFPEVAGEISAQIDQVGKS
jgi:phosphomannomutase